MSKNSDYNAFPGQFKGEEVMLSFKRHPIVMRKGLIILMICVLMGALFGLFNSRNTVTLGDYAIKFFLPVLYGFAAGGIGLFYYWIGWHYSICIVTNQRFLQFNQKGIFKSRSVNDIPLDRILSVNYQVRGVMETLLGFGTITVQTYVGELVIKDVEHPKKIHKKLTMLLREHGYLQASGNRAVAQNGETQEEE